MESILRELICINPLWNGAAGMCTKVAKYFVSNHCQQNTNNIMHLTVGTFYKIQKLDLSLLTFVIYFMFVASGDTFNFIEINMCHHYMEKWYNWSGYPAECVFLFCCVQCTRTEAIKKVHNNMARNDIAYHNYTFFYQVVFNDKQLSNNV
jgi:hypothetical protein